MYWRNTSNLDERIEADKLFEEIKFYIEECEELKSEYLDEFPEFNGEIVVDDIVAEWFLQDWKCFNNETEEIIYAYNHSYFGISSDIRYEYEEYEEARMNEYALEMRGTPCYNM